MNNTKNSSKPKKKTIIKKPNKKPKSDLNKTIRYTSYTILGLILLTVISVIATTTITNNQANYLVSDNITVNNTGVFYGGAKSFTKTADVVVCRGENPADDLKKSFECDVVCKSTDSNCHDEINNYTSIGNLNIYIDKGNYPVGDHIYYNSNTTIIGAGRGLTVFKLKDSSSSTWVSSSGIFDWISWSNRTNITDVTIKSLTIDGNRYGGTNNNVYYSGINMIDIQRGLIEDIEVHDVSEVGIVAQNTRLNQNVAGTVRENPIIVRDCYSHDNQVQGYQGSALYENCFAYDNPTGFVIASISGSGYAPYGTATYINCIAFNNSYRGFSFENQGAQNHSTVLMINSQSIKNGGIGISVSIDNVHITGGTSEFNGAEGVSLYQTDYSTVNGMTIINNNQNSSYPNNKNAGLTANDVNNILISNNYIFDDQITPTQLVGININSANSMNNTAINNYLKLNTLPINGTLSAWVLFNNYGYNTSEISGDLNVTGNTTLKSLITTDPLLTITNPLSDDGLVLYYPFTNGILRDFSSRGNSNFTAYNGTYNSSGKIGGSWRFNGTTGGSTNIRIYTTNTSITNETTISAWVNFESAGSRYIIAKSSYGLTLSIQSGKPTFFVKNSSTTYTASSPTTISTNTWYLFTGTYKDGTANLYVNGVLVNSTTYGSQLGLVAGTDTYFIGTEDGSGSPMFGKIDELRLYNRALNSNEVNSLYTLNSESYSGTSNYRIGEDINPLKNILYNLGSSTLRWLKLWVKDIDASGIINGTRIESQTNYSVNDKTGITKNFNITLGNLTTCYQNFTGGILTSTTC